jgi:tetratricopeptide (TPR) repeat protein
MKRLLFVFFILFIAVSGNGQQPDSSELFGQPLMERYVLDELKSLRQDQQRMVGEIHKQLADAQLKSADRAIEYTTNTTNNIFYIITAAASLLVILGWKSLNDIKRNLTVSTEKKLHKLTNAYEERLNVIEDKMKERSKVIIDNQEKITSTNNIHSLWMRAGLEKSEEDKIAVYDEILQINPQDIEAMTYKADALLEIDEVRWALNLTNHAIDLDKSYSQAFWQRACAYARLNRKSEAVKDIKKAIEISESLADELEKETHFESIKASPEFQKIMTKYTKAEDTK